MLSKNQLNTFSQIEISQKTYVDMLKNNKSTKYSFQSNDKQFFFLHKYFAINLLKITITVIFSSFFVKK